MTTYNLLFALLALILVSLSSSLPCTLSTPRTARGSELKCQCPGIHTTIVPVVASVDVGIRCLNICLRKATRSACRSTDGSFFRRIAREQRPVCCSRCGGSFKDGRCNRDIIESSQLPPPDDGCLSKIRETVSGQSYACRCKSGPNFQVPFFIATGVNDDCLLRCGGAQNFSGVCADGEAESDIRQTFLSWFELCCAKSCASRNLDGGFTCGKSLK